MSSIREQIPLLEQLSAIDTDVRRLDVQLEKESGNREGMRADVKGVDARLKVDRDRLSDMDKTRGELIVELRQMATQPDMIADYARHLRERFEARGYRDVQVFAHAWVSFNGRRNQRLVDPTVDLSRAERSFAPKSWILPLDAEHGRKLLAHK